MHAGKPPESETVNKDRWTSSEWAAQILVKTLRTLDRGHTVDES